MKEQYEIDIKNEKNYDKRFEIKIEMTDREYLGLIKAVLDYKDQITKNEPQQTTETGTTLEDAVRA